MQLTFDATLVQLVVSFVFAVLGAGELVRRLRGKSETPPTGPRSRANLLIAVALLVAASYFLLGRHPQQLVKTWDVRHTWLGARYHDEVGYFRIYQCMLHFDAQGPRRYTTLEKVSDLRQPRHRVSPAELVGGNDCDQRFTSGRRQAFQSDVSFFHELARRPHEPSWFTDNGYNQTPFFTAVTAPIFEIVPLSYGLLLGYAIFDIALEILAVVVLYFAFGPRACALAAIYFFTSFSNQFAAMGGAILRFAYIALLMIAVSAFHTRRYRSAGAALALASLFQVFPAVYAAGLLVWSGMRAMRGEAIPNGFKPGAIGFAITLALGIGGSLLVVSVDTWIEFFQKMAVHNLQFSQYRVGLKALFVLDWPIAPGGWIDYGAKLETLRRTLPLWAVTGVALTASSLLLVRRLSALEFSLLFGTVVLYVLTPVHYYFASLVLLFLIGWSSTEEGFRIAPLLIRTLLFAVSAGAFMLFRWSDGGSPQSPLPLVNNYWLSITLLLVIVASGVSLSREWRAPAVAGIPAGEPDPTR